MGVICDYDTGIQTRDLSHPKRESYSYKKRRCDLHPYNNFRYVRVYIEVCVDWCRPCRPSCHFVCVCLEAIALIEIHFIMCVLITSAQCNTACYYVC